MSNVLKGTDRNPVVHRFQSFDTEDDSEGNVKQISLTDTDGRGFFHFKRRDDFIRHLYETADGPRVILATNLEYDLLNAFGPRLDLLSFRMKSGGSTIVSARLHKTRTVFYDTLNHAPLGVARQGEILNLPKLPMDLSSWDYVDRDALITHRFGEYLQSGYNEIGTQFNATLPGSALFLYRRLFLPFPITQPKLAALDFIREGYYGGRVEVFNTSEQNGSIFYHDVNSMYPYVMRGPFPNPNVYAFKRILDLDAEGVADLTITVDGYIPPLPYRDEKLVFPVGRFRGVWCYPEIRFALECGARIDRVHRVLEFPSSCEPFTEYVDTLYPYKQGSGALAYCAKLMLNSLYGKFGERVEEITITPTDQIPPDKPATIYGDFAYVRGREYYPDHSNGIWSAYTTSKARVLLASTMHHILGQGGTLLYCDTDSIIYKAERQLIPESKEIGAWKLEGRFNTAHFLAPKLYALLGDGDRRYRAKGIPRAEAKRFFDEGTASYRRPYRMRSALRRGLLRTQWVDFKRTRKTDYDKRIVLESGETRPIMIEPTAISRAE